MKLYGDERRTTFRLSAFRLFVLFVLLIFPVLNNHAFCGEIHDATRNGDRTTKGSDLII